MQAGDGRLVRLVGGIDMDYTHLYRLTKQDLKDIIVLHYPHLKGSLYKCSKRDLIAEIKERWEVISK